MLMLAFCMNLQAENLPPLVSWNAILPHQCVSSTGFSLFGGIPAGGTYSGPGVMGTNFNASLAGVGLHTLSYTVTDSSGLTSTAYNTIQVVALPVVTIGNLANVCVSSASIPLTTGSPAGGYYSGPGISGNNFNPSLPGVGTHIITYMYINMYGCVNSATTTLIINPLPIVTWSAFLNPQYTNTTTYPLTGGLPPGGTYTGPGVSVNNFNAAIAGPGIHTLTYSYKDANNCSNSVTNSILTLLPPDTLSDLSGVLSYANTASTKLENAIIQLTKNGTWIAETLTNANGEYQFTDLQPGTYMLKAIVNQPGGGGNAVDALLIMKHFVGMTTLASPWLEACDVDASSFVNATDGMEVMKRFVGMINSFASGDWYSETPVITLSGGSAGVQNLKAVCFGDVDGSFVP